MAANTYAKRRSGRIEPLPPLVMFQERRQAPSSALINAILEYADIQHPLGGGRVILRLSPKRMKDPVIKASLGREAKRLADVSVLWDEEEGTLIRVLDDAAEAEPSMDFEDDPSELDSFELTEAALAYIASGQRPRR
jgi:hypothetical protein